MPTLAVQPNGTMRNSLALAVLTCLTCASSLGCGGAAAPASASTTAGGAGGGGSTTTTTGGGGAGGGSTASGGGGHGAGGSPTTSTGGAGGSAQACAPAPGNENVSTYCDQVKIAVLGHGAGQARVSFRGRLTSSKPGACLRFDSVDIVDAGSKLVQHIPVVGFALHSEDVVPWIEADAVAAVTAPCGSDATRAEAFHVVVKGAVDGGTFEAMCGPVGGGASWPPLVQLTCHEGLDAPPSFDTYATVQVDAKLGITMTQLSATFPDADGIAAVDATVHVVPEVWLGQPIAPFDTAGWTTSVSPAQGTAQVGLFQDKDVLGSELCPVPNPAPKPGDPVPPIFLARIKGTAAKGPFSSELYVAFCSRISN